MTEAEEFTQDILSRHPDWEEEEREREEASYCKRCASEFSLLIYRKKHGD